MGHRDLILVRRLQEINAGDAVLDDTRRRQAYDRKRPRVRAPVGHRAAWSSPLPRGFRFTPAPASRAGLALALVLGWIADGRRGVAATSLAGALGAGPS